MRGVLRTIPLLIPADANKFMNHFIKDHLAFVPLVVHTKNAMNLSIIVREENDH